MVTFTLTTPGNVGTLTKPIAVSSLNVTAVSFATVPSPGQAPMPLGTGLLTVTLTDPVSGWQVTFSYQDATVLSFFAQAAPAPPSGATAQDVMAQLVFTKLIADGKLPAGTVTVLNPQH